ncbi:carbon-nitrogen hydrolase [Natronospira bacteriovora]|uniref:Carbon-nitrogen hydrolase n=1 Tax=Natronospira bacteriovora TaxID=3069753 RepID=A0ABU0W2N8_9GAMM|nr:carbon-nitrogen hydrolase [Natronospira sp. AB-CW4]MDQ2068268.1 carbon-nitrogen hydrolase [Natronospira sp. AB-CW4]
MRHLPVALIQERNQGGRDGNLRRIEERLREAAANGARLALLQELHNGPYFCQTQDTARFDLAEAIPGHSTELLGRLAAELELVIVASLFEKRAAGLYHNTAVALDSDGRIAGRYRKMHIPDDPGFNEKFYFTPGDSGFEPIDTSVGRLGVLVCWDQWYPEAARLMALAGAEMLIYPTAIGWSAEDDAAEQGRQLDAWRTVQRGHAVANALPVLVTNRVGHEPHPERPGEGIDFWGHSFVAGPQGEILAEAGTEPELLQLTLDLGRCEQVRRIWPFLRDRRIDAYGDLLRRYRS